MLLGNVKIKLDFFFNFCGLLTISELYIQGFSREEFINSKLFVKSKITKLFTVQLLRSDSHTQTLPPNVNRGRTLNNPAKNHPNQQQPSISKSQSQIRQRSVSENRNGSSVEEDIVIYRLPGEKLGLGLRFGFLRLQSFQAKKQNGLNFIQGKHPYFQLHTYLRFKENFMIHNYVHTLCKISCGNVDASNDEKNAISELISTHCLAKETKLDVNKCNKCSFKHCFSA